MKRFLMVAAAGLLVSCLMASSAWAFGLKDVMTMSRDGVPDSLIVAKIQHSGTTFHLDAKDFQKLRAAGVSNGVIMAMVRTEDAQKTVVVPYDAWNDPWLAYRWPWYAGVDFGWYGPPYWYAPRVHAWRQFDRDDMAFAHRAGPGRVGHGGRR